MRKTRLSTENWIDEYIYSDIHEIFFAEFPILLYEWLSRLVTKQTNFQRRDTVKWSDHLVREVTSVTPFIELLIFGLTIYCKDILLSLQ